MEPPVLVAVISSTQLIILAILTPILKHILDTKKMTREVKEEVKNDHTTNLREEQDARHDEQMGANAAIYSQVQQTSQAMQSLSGIVQNLAIQFSDHILWSGDYTAKSETRFRDLEDSLTRQQKDSQQ